MRFQPVDHVPDEEFGYWTDTLTRWHAQGLPAWVDDNGKADRYFGFARRDHAPVGIGLMPGFEERVLEVTDRHRVIQDASGVTCVVNRDGSSSIPKYLEFPIRDRRSWESFRRRLDPGTAGRYPAPERWEALKAGWRDRDYPLGISVGSLFGWIRNWMGFEGVSLMLYDDPGLVEEIVEHLTGFLLDTTGRAIREVDFDFASMWEDMCFNHGPILSPEMFERLLVPRYRRITDVLRGRGVEVVYLDCDGNILELVGLWRKGGVNTMFPVEVGGGSDPAEIRERFGDRVLLMGGVDKRALIAGREAIRRELDRIAPVVAAGGYIPHVDHRVPPDVDYADYLYYLDAKRDRFGVPRPLPYEARAEEARGVKVRQEDLLNVRT
jgi:uroporphyrinogen decarboxylase